MMKTMINHAKVRALQSILNDFPPPPRMTTPKASRERLRKVVEDILATRSWRLYGELFNVQAVVLDIVNGERTLKVKAKSLVDNRLLELTLDEWMKEAT